MHTKTKDTSVKCEVKFEVMSRETGAVAHSSIPRHEPLQYTARQLENHGNGRTYGASVITAMPKPAERERKPRRV